MWLFAVLSFVICGLIGLISVTDCSSSLYIAVWCVLYTAAWSWVNSWRRWYMETSRVTRPSPLTTLQPTDSSTLSRLTKREPTDLHHACSLCPYNLVTLLSVCFECLLTSVRLAITSALRRQPSLPDACSLCPFNIVTLLSVCFECLLVSVRYSHYLRLETQD